MSHLPHLSSVEDVYELSPLQEGMLFHALYDPAARVYVEQVNCPLHGPIDLALFTRSWQQLFDRHAALRTAFYWRDLDRPLQVVHRGVRAPIESEDWRALSGEEQRRRFESFLKKDRARGFELAEPPLIRLALVRTSDAEYRLTLSFHHLILDGWSLQILNREFQQIYRAAERGEVPALPDTVPFRELVTRLRQADRAAARNFWRERLAGFEAPPSLRSGRPGAATAPVQSTATCTEHLSPAATRALEAFAQRHQLTLHTLLCGAWALLLGRNAGRSDVVFGSVLSGRAEPLDGIDAIVGLCINTVPVRVVLPAGVTVDSWLSTIQSEAASAAAHSHLPLVEIRKAVRWPAEQELFETLLTFENHESRTASPSSPIQVSHWSSYPLGITVTAGEAMSFVLPYDPSCFAPDQVAATARDFRRLLEMLPDAAALPLAALQATIGASSHAAPGIVVSAEEIRRPVHEDVAAQAAATPDAVAVTFEGHSITYSVLDAWTSRLSDRLQRAGVRVDDVVGLCMDRSLELVASVLGVLRAGAAYLPLDPEYPPERLAQLIRDARPAHLLVQPHCVHCVGAATAPWSVVTGSIEAADVPLLPDLPVDPANACYVLYTSGSTGSPKGVVNCHSGLSNRLRWMQAAYRLDASDVVLQKTPFSFDVSVWEFVWPFMTGARLVVARPGGHRDPHYLADLITREQVTTLHFVPSMLAAFLTHAEPHAGRTLRRVFCGGEAMTSSLRSRTHARWKAPLHNLYGPTEASIDVTAHTCDRGDTSSVVPIGYPIANTSIHVLDADHAPVAPGSTGELCIGGVGLARGYLGRPALTAELFVPDPISGEPGARMYRTGDLCRRRPDGQIEFLGRADHQIKLRGHRIELGEIEHVLRQQAGVRDAVVVARNDGDVPRLVAYVVASDPAHDSAFLRQRLRERLPEYMVPATFVLLDHLPITAHGKLDRAALPAPAPLNTAARETPRTQVEELLAGIWADVLDRDRVGLHDSFFELGGDSIEATRLISRVNAALGLNLPLRAIFDAPTVGALAEAHCGHHPAAGQMEIPRVAREGSLPLSFAQQRLWFLQRLEPDGWAYNVVVPVRLSGNLHRDALAAALNQIVTRHEILRTTVDVNAGEPVQRVHEDHVVSLAYIDLAGTPDSEATLQSVVQREGRKPFDLSRLPMLRATLIRIAPEEHVLLLVVHHIATDAWSSGILISELTRIYEAEATGRAIDLPVPPLQYADFAVWQRRTLTPDTLAPQLGYWRGQLAGAPLRLEPPGPAVQRSAQAARAGTHAFRIDSSITRRIGAVSRRESVTPFMVLLSGLGALLRQYYDRDDFLIGAPFAGRTRSELETIVGSFVNTLPLRLTLAGSQTFAGLLRHTREVSLGAAANQDVPFDQLVEVLGPSRDVGVHPIYQVVFTMQNAPQPSSGFKHLRVEPVVSGAVLAAKFDLVVNVWHAGSELAGSVEYASDLFDEETVRCMFEDYTSVLDSLCADPEMQLDDLDLLPPHERRLLAQSTAIPELAERIVLGG